MASMFTLRRYIAYLIIAVGTVSGWVIGAFINPWYSGPGMAIAMIISFQFANAALKNPFWDMMERRGVLAVDINSTGIMRFFLLGLNHPYVKSQKHKVTDAWDRQTVAQIIPPKPPSKDRNVAIDKHGNVTINLNKDEFNDARFQFLQYPVILYNGVLKSLITKDAIQKLETKTMAEHIMLHTNRKLEDMERHWINIGRYVISKLESSGLAGGWMMWVIIAVILVIVIVMFGPQLSQMFSGAVSSAGATISPQ